MDFASLADFHAAARFGSFSEAARRTDTPKATISRRIAKLEEKLNLQLFERGNRSLRLTEEGRQLHRRTAALLNELTLVGEELAGVAGIPQGRLRISAPGLFAQEHLGSLAACFVNEHPQVSLEIEVQDHFADPRDDDFDIVIRVNPDPTSLLVGRRLYAQPALAVAAPSIERPTADDSCVRAVTPLMWPADDEWVLVSDDGRLRLRPVPVLRFSSPLPLCKAVLAGAGAGVLPLSVAKPHLLSGALVTWGRLEGRDAEVWVLHADAKPQSAKVTALIALLVNHFANISGTD